MVTGNQENDSPISAVSIQHVDATSQGAQQPIPSSHEDTTLKPLSPTSSQSIDKHSHMPPSGDANSLPGLPDSDQEDPSIGAASGTDLDQGGNELATKADDRLPIRQSLSLSGCVIIFGGSVLILLVTAFLIFLWAGEGPTAGGAEATRLWRLIMLHDWAIRAVTLSCVVLRSVIASQATVCTSLVAALFVERRQVRVSKVAQMSITRSVNNGPRQLIQDIISSGSLKTVFSPEAVILMVLAIGTLGVQFSSTILLPGFDDASLLQERAVIQHNVAVSLQKDADVQAVMMSSWQHYDGSIALFGESDSGGTAEPNEYGVSHSGPKQRAFLPFEHENRTRMRYFKGPAFTLKTEASCLRPSMDVQLQGDDWLSEAWVAGDISYNQTFDNAGVNRYVDCIRRDSKDIYGDSDLGEDYISYCLPTSLNCSIPYTPYNLYGPASMVFLAFATNAGVINYGRLDTPIAHEEWNSYELYPGRFLNISLCFLTHNTTISEVEMASNSDLAEPEFIWSPSLNTPSLNTLQKFMGADAAHSSIDERGIFAVEQVQHPISPSTLVTVSAAAAEQAISYSEWIMWDQTDAALWSRDAFNGSFNLCIGCWMRGETTPRDGAALFMQIINSSNRAAVAVETYIARLAQEFYYLLLPLFDVPGHVKVVFSAEVSIPRNWGGLIAMLVMVLVDLACIWIITALYVKNIRYTREGDFWHAVSQLVAEPTESILQQSSELRDREVAKLLEGNDLLVTISRSAKTGKVEVVKV